MNAVEHPNHYNNPDGMECIDEMIAVFGKRKVMDFCLLNVWKYRYRALDKNGAQDMKKSHEYMKIYIKLKDGEEGKEGNYGLFPVDATGNRPKLFGKRG